MKKATCQTNDVNVASAAQNRVTGINLGGTWRMKDFTLGIGGLKKVYLPVNEPEDCLPCEVPGTVRSALLEAGEIPDPYYGYDNEKSMWVEQKEWWFFKRFSVSGALSGKYVELAFDGTSFSGDCWLNGSYVGELEGMLNPRAFEVSRLLKYGEENQIAIRLQAPPDARENSIEHGLTWRGDRDQLYSIAQCMYGWDWGPHALPVGIWKSVALRISGPVMIDNPLIRTTIVSDTEARCGIGLDIRNLSDSMVVADISGFISEKRSQRVAGEFRRTLTLGPRETKRSDSEVVVKDPKLWWPNGLGDQDLYIMNATAKIGDVESDDLSEQFGIRELRLVDNENVGEFLGAMQEDIGDAHHLGNVVGSYPWTFEINGIKMFAKGANWVPVDQLLRLDLERYGRLLLLFKGAHFNLLRVWGGGLYETEDFYRLCDEYGILVWQEFLSNRNFSNIDSRNFLEGASSAVLRLRNHPSLAFWCGGNEFDPDDSGSRTVVDSLAALLNTLDPGREFHRASPYMGDDHYWGVWHHLEPYTKYRIVRPFRSEAGLSAPPVWENYVKFTPANLLWPPDSAFIEYHGESSPRLCHLGKLLRYADEFGEASDMQELITGSQLYQAIGNEFDMEFCRENKFRNSGFLVWQYNDIWPCISWSIVDWYGEPKPSYYFLKRASRPVHISADYERYLWNAGETFRTDIYLLNDSHAPVSGLKFVATLMDRDGKVIAGKSGTAGAEVNSSVKVGAMECTIPIPMRGKVLFMSVQLKGKTGREISDALYPIAVSEGENPGNYRGILAGIKHMPELLLDIRAVKSDLTLESGGKGNCVFRISNPTKHLAFFVRARMIEESDYVRTMYDDNYVTLLPGESKDIPVEVEVKKPERVPPALHFEFSGINCRKKMVEIGTGRK